MTDAVARWFAQSLEQNGTPWVDFDRLLALDDDVIFRRWVERRRELDGMRNDDVTVVRLCLLP
jgi:hypothetical protein